MGWGGQGPPGQELRFNGGRVRRVCTWVKQYGRAGRLPHHELGRALRGRETGRHTGLDAGTWAHMAGLAGVSPSLLLLSETGREDVVEQSGMGRNCVW